MCIRDSCTAGQPFSSACPTTPHAAVLASRPPVAQQVGGGADSGLSSEFDLGRSTTCGSTLGSAS
eukprot:12789171-Alexandrium_andersonii.AAC.1